MTTEVPPSVLKGIIESRFWIRGTGLNHTDVPFNTLNSWSSVNSLHGGASDCGHEEVATHRRCREEWTNCHSPPTRQVCGSFFKTNEILCHCDGPICVITSRHSGVVLVTLVLYVNLVGM